MNYEEIKPFMCTICEYKTAHKPSLKRHIESVHEEIKPFKCKTCDYKTAHRPILKRHIETVPGIKGLAYEVQDHTW